MANARAAQLQAQRSQYTNPLGGTRIRTLAPAQTGISSIAKTNASNELTTMISKYNDGYVSNADMKVFLTNQLPNPYLMESDKKDIANKLRDFDVLIEKDRLEAVYKSAPDNSLQQSQAATALSKFYSDRAATMEPGTPAQSVALQNAAQWQGTVQTINSNVNNLQRKNLEQTKLQQINQLPTSSSERSLAQADLYKQLADMATAQGDSADASSYMAKYEQAKTVADQYGAQEQQKQSLNDIKQFSAEQDLAIAKLTDKTTEELKSKAEKAYAVAQKYADIGDQLNYTKYMTIGTQAEEKYNKRVASDKATSASASWDQEDYKLDNALRLAQQFVKDGFTPDGKPYTSADYKNDVASVVTAKSTVLENRMQVVNDIAANNPNEKVMYNGKKQRAADVLDQINKEQQDVQPQADAVKNGNFAIVEVPPKESGKNPTGKSVTSYQVVDKNNIDPNQMVADTNGLYHAITRERIQLTPQQVKDNSIPGSNVYTDPATGVSSYMKANPDGTYYVEGSAKVDTYEPGGTKKISIPYDPSKPEKFGSFSQEAYLAQDQTHVSGNEAAAQMMKAKNIQAQQKALPNAPVKPVAITPPAGTKINTPQPAVPTNNVEIGKTPAINPMQPNGSLIPGLSAPKPIENKQPSISQPTPGLTYNTPAPIKPISIGTATPVNIPQAISSGGLKINYTPPPTPPKVVAPTPQPTTLQKIATTISTTSPFSWLKKTLGF